MRGAAGLNWRAWHLYSTSPDASTALEAHEPHGCLCGRAPCGRPIHDSTIPCYSSESVGIVRWRAHVDARQDAPGWTGTIGGCSMAAFSMPYCCVPQAWLNPGETRSRDVLRVLTRLHNFKTPSMTLMQEAGPWHHATPGLCCPLGSSSTGEGESDESALGRRGGSVPSRTQPSQSWQRRVLAKIEWWGQVGCWAPGRWVSWGLVQPRNPKRPAGSRSRGCRLDDNKAPGRVDHRFATSSMGILPMRVGSHTRAASHACRVH